MMEVIFFCQNDYRRHFINEDCLKTHFKSKPHKRRYVYLLEGREGG